MKSLTTYINEKLVISKNIDLYTEHPKTKEELRNIIKKRLKEDKNADLNDIDVSEIEDMSYLFSELNPHNIDISSWDVSNVKNTSWMFRGCESFNSNLSNWDVRNVKDMYRMFEGCENFNSDLSNWDVRNVKDMRGMFDDCDSLKNIPDWYKK